MNSRSDRRGGWTRPVQARIPALNVILFHGTSLYCPGGGLIFAESDWS